MTRLTSEEQDKLDAQTFRRLLSHLEARSDVQNIDLMILSGFCRNCLGKWYKDAADSAGIDMTDAEARNRVYGMDYGAWKSLYQTPVTPDKLDAFAKSKLKS